jgi:hypothetical protein
MNKSTYIYIHVCCINNWKAVFNQLIADIKDSGLYNKINKIRCNVLTQDPFDVEIFMDSKIEIIGLSNNLNLYEISTINLIHEHSFFEEFNVLYLHTKGVTKPANTMIEDWVKYLSYFNIYKHDECMKELETYDTVGVSLKENPLHYSGNFWWSKSEYIRKLERCFYRNHNSPEFWISEKKIGKYLSLWDSVVNHYHVNYHESNYKNKGVQKYSIL